MRTRTWLALVASAALVLGACGNDNDSGSGDDAKPSEKADSEKADPKKDQALADAMILTLEDFPPGYTEGEEVEETSEDDEDNPFKDCDLEGIDELEDATTAEAESPSFTKGETTQVNSEAMILETDDDAEEGFDLIASEEAEDCLTESAKEEFASGSEDAEFGEPTLRRASFPKVGDEALAYQLSVPISSEGVELTIYADIVVFRAGRAIGTLSFTNLDEPLDADVQRVIATSMAERAAG